MEIFYLLAKLANITSNYPHKLTDENISKNSKNHTFYTFDRWKPFMPKNFTLSLAAGTHIQMDLELLKCQR